MGPKKKRSRFVLEDVSVSGSDYSSSSASDNDDDDDSDSWHTSDYESAVFTSSPSSSLFDEETSSSSSSSVDSLDWNINRLQTIAMEDSRYQVLSRGQQNVLLQHIADYVANADFTQDSALQRLQRVQEMIGTAVEHLQQASPNLLRTACNRCRVSSDRAKLRRHECERCAVQFFLCWNHRINTIHVRSLCSACIDIGSVSMVSQCHVCTNAHAQMLHVACEECEMVFSVCPLHRQPILKSHCMKCVQNIVARNHLPNCIHCQIPIKPSDPQSMCAVCQRPMHEVCTRSCICPSCLETGSLASCSVCHTEIAVQQVALCRQCHKPIHANRSCAVNGYCQQCYLPTQCASCKSAVEARSRGVVNCRICNRACHARCLNRDRSCSSCHIQCSHEAIVQHRLPALTTCRFGCGARQFFSTRSFCCSMGRHILPDHITAMPLDLSTYIDNWWDILIESGREINQLASLTSIGVVNSENRTFGGVQSIHNDTCVLTVDGQMYHFPVFHDGVNKWRRFFQS